MTRDGGLPVRSAIAEFLDDPRLIFVDRDQNRGLPYSFNQALARARGEYICYLGDDDLFYPFHIELLLKSILSQDRCQVVYSDLYKVHCRVSDTGDRVVLSKNVEISRDFDRMLMLQFNHALHVSLMHHRDLVRQAGPYNEDLNVLIDWDLTRRLCFYSDFLHVPVVTGEYYAPIGDCDRISVQRRKNVNEFMTNLLTIRNTRPPKPWPCMHDLSVIILAEHCDDHLRQWVSQLWTQGYFPKQIYVPLPEKEVAEWDVTLPHVFPVPVRAGLSDEQKIDAVLMHCEGDYIALVSADLSFENEEVSFLERSLNPLIQHNEANVVYEIVEATDSCWGAVLAKDSLAHLRKAHPALSIRRAALVSGMTVKKPAVADYPFQFDHLLTVARELESQGDWAQAGRMYQHIASHCGNVSWMKTLEANAMYQRGHMSDAAELVNQLNQADPTVARLMIQARMHLQRDQWTDAVDYYRKAEAILEGTSFGYSLQQIESILGEPDASGPHGASAQGGRP